MDKIAYFFLYSISKLPFWVLYKIADFLSFVMIYLIPYRKKVIIENLTNSFPDKSEEEIKVIWKKFTLHFADVLVETLKGFSAGEKELSKRLEFINPEIVTKYIEDNRTVIFATGHKGNWEYFSMLPIKFPGFHSVDGIYAKVKNKLVDEKMYEARTKFGITLFEMKESVRKIAQLDKDKSHLLGILFDQSPHKSKVVYDLNFLNQLTPVHLGTEFLAKMRDAVIFTMDIQRVKRGYYQVKLDLVTDTPKETKDYEITNKIFQILEEQIIREPESWLWSHRRWKYKAGRDYNLDENKKRKKSS